MNTTLKIIHVLNACNNNKAISHKISSTLFVKQYFICRTYKYIYYFIKLSSEVWGIQIFENRVKANKNFHKTVTVVAIAFFNLHSHLLWQRSILIKTITVDFCLTVNSSYQWDDMTQFGQFIIVDRIFEDVTEVCRMSKTVSLKVLTCLLLKFHPWKIPLNFFDKPTILKTSCSQKQVTLWCYWCAVITWSKLCITTYHIHLFIK